MSFARTESSKGVANVIFFPSRRFYYLQHSMALNFGFCLVILMPLPWQSSRNFMHLQNTQIHQDTKYRLQLIHNQTKYCPYLINQWLGCLKKLVASTFIVQPKLLKPWFETSWTAIIVYGLKNNITTCCCSCEGLPYFKQSWWHRFMSYSFDWLVTPCIL